MCRFAPWGIALQQQHQQQFASKTKETNKVQSSTWRRYGCTTMCGKPRDTGPGALLAPFVSLPSSPLSPSLSTPQQPSFQYCETSLWCTLCTTIQPAPAMRSYWSGHICRSRSHLTWVKAFKDVPGIAAFSEACFVNGTAAWYRPPQVTPRMTLISTS